MRVVTQQAMLPQALMVLGRLQVPRWGQPRRRRVRALLRLQLCRPWHLWQPAPRRCCGNRFGTSQNP
jgi:hypothetical protein